jgi:hypothetical protein
MEDEDYDSFRKEAYQYYLNNAMPYAIGHLSDLLKWNSYPVDLLEVQHNESIYSYNSISGKGIQHNRNPFVDYPELVNYIYGDLKDQPGKLSNLSPTFKALEMDKDEINHYRVNSNEINSYTDEERPEVWDFNIEAVKNNLSTSKVTDFEGFSIKEVFPLSEDQIVDGYAYITIVTPINEIKVCIKVTDANAITFDTCTWNYIDNNTSGHNKDCYGTYNNGVFSNAVFNGLSWTVTLGNAIPSNKISNSKTDGTKFGTADYPVGTITFETNSSINFDGNTLVNAIYCISSTASGKAYGYEFFVGGVSVCNGTYTGSLTEMVAELNEPLEGKVKIVLSNITAAVNIRGLAINVVSE